MATIVPACEYISKGVAQITWSGLSASGDVGRAHVAPDLNDKTVYVEGPAGGTTQVVLEGTNTATGTYTTLTDPLGNALEFTTATTAVILQNPRYIRPRLNTATGVSVNVIIVARGSM